MIASLTPWVVLYWAWLVSEVAIAVGTYTPPAAGDVRDRGSQIVLWIVIGAAVTACPLMAGLVGIPMFGGASWLRSASIVLFAVALAIRWTAVLTLGRSFSSNVAIQRSQRIQRTGLYRYIRHPSYLGLLLVVVAIGIHSRNWLGLAVAVVPSVAVLVHRMTIEEAALRAAFGDEYSAYARVAKRLIPGVY